MSKPNGASRETFSIRAVTLQDVPFLWEMLYDSLYVPEGGELFDRKVIKEPSISKYVEGWGREGDRGYVAIDQSGRSMGSVMMRYFTKDNRGYGYMDEETPELTIAVKAEYRGMGIGTSLLQKLLNESKLLGLKRISLSVDPRNPAADLYRRMGFKEAGEAGTSITMIVSL
ncbi:GNAT family N-acetyltransferase [Paenibacillus sp. MBLB4367]|uniref:GNAT family N-acetyltransferase n=1 Tax=Paenibacillus sp. MBLB4367 TaxID=3384767 RepID=UPI0039084570